MAQASTRTSQRDPLWLRLGCLATALGVVGIGALCTGLNGLSMGLMAPGHFVLAVILATAFTLPYSILLRTIDRNEPEPRWLLALTFLWGAVVATAISGLFNDAMGNLLALVFPPWLADQMTASFSAPFIEEITKGSALAVLVVAFRHHFDNVLDGILYGAFIGLGFAWFENIYYYVTWGVDAGVVEMIKLSYVRGFLNGIASHAAYTGLVGLGFGLWRVMRSGWLRWLMPPLFLVIAMAAHFAWNSFAGVVVGLSTTSELASYVIGLPLAVALLQAPFVMMLVFISVFALRHEDQLIHLFLESEADDVLPAALRGQLAPARRRMANGVARLFKRGPGAWWRARTQERLLIELAFAKWHHKRDQHAWHLDEDDDVRRLRARLVQLSDAWK